MARYLAVAACHCGVSVLGFLCSTDREWPGVGCSAWASLLQTLAMHQRQKRLRLEIVGGWEAASGRAVTHWT
eukprot:scaffold587_cov109-Isochrysis_galbana.AAC.4